MGDRLQARAFFGELKRRNVLRAGALYAAAAWALAQGAAQLLPVYSVPAWVMRWIIAALIIGFPFWLAFAWIYEITPSGLKRESQITPGDSIAHSTGRKLDFWIIGILALAVVLLVTNTFVLHRDATSTATAADAKTIAAELAKVPQKSVAVLPLTNESGNAKQQYFVDGLSEELISDLTQVTGLKVIGKYSSFKFRDSKDTLAQIGAELGVAHLLQGSVRQEGGRIRVTVSMVSAKDGASLWSHSYDEQLKDVFAIQSKIGQAVAEALKVKLLGKPIVASDKPPSGNVEAYEMMLQGQAIYRRGTESSIRQGIALFQQAVKLDPNYAYVWGMLSNAWINLGVLYLSGDAQALQQANTEARTAANREQLLAPDAPFTHSDRGYVLSAIDNDPVGALAEYQRAVALAPNDASSLNHVATGLMNLGKLQQAADIYRKILATDPLRADVYSSLAIALLGQRNLDAAGQALRKASGMQPDFPGLHSIRTQIDVLRGDAGAARSAAAKVVDPVVGPWARALAEQIDPDHRKADAALHDYIAKNGKDQPYLVADLYALRKQQDEMFDWLQRAWKQHDPNLIATILSDPFVLAYRNDPRFVALCNHARLPLPGQVLAGDSVPVSASSSGH